MQRSKVRAYSITSLARASSVGGTLRPIADAILDRLVHNAHRLILKGESLRKARSQAPQP
jgi:DNA replication protein DnaC